MKSVRVRISGRVQGVWFRVWTKQQARALSLDGWVRNCIDGNVEALFAGPDEAVDEMIAQCRSGPPLACVRAISSEQNEYPNASGFHILSNC